MKKLFASLALAAMLVAPAHAAALYASSTDFLQKVAPGAYTETFDREDYSRPRTTIFSNGTYSYSAFGDDGLWFNGAAMSTGYGYDELIVTFTGAPVTAIGGNFYITDHVERFMSTMLTIVLSDGTRVTSTPASVADSYLGFTSEIGITSIVLSTQEPWEFAAIDNFTVGSALVDAPGEVPEPVSLALLGAGLLAAAAARRRRRAG